MTSLSFISVHHRELALGLDELLLGHHAAAATASAVPAPGAEKTAEAACEPLTKKPAVEILEQTKPAPDDHSTGPLKASREDDQLHEEQYGQRCAQDDHDRHGNVYSHLGKRQMDEEPAYDQHHSGQGRNVRKRQRQDHQQSPASSSGVGYPTADQLRYMEKLNRVTVQSSGGFKNAGDGAAPMIPPFTVPAVPPVAVYPPALNRAPYGGGQGGYPHCPSYEHPSYGYGAPTNPRAPNLSAVGSLQPSFEEECTAAVAVLANAVHSAGRFPQERDELTSILDRNRMTFCRIKREGVALEVCHFPRALGKFPSFLDSAKQYFAVSSDLIFRRIQQVDQMRFDGTIDALKKGYHAIWCGHPGIGKSTEANFVLLEFLLHLSDGEDSEWRTKVAHRVNGRLFLYTWNAVDREVKCEMLPGKTLQDVQSFCFAWEDQETKECPVLFLELGEHEIDPQVSIPTFIALSSDDVQAVLKTMDKSRAAQYFLVRPHEPEELLLMAKLMFETDSKSLCARLDGERSWEGMAKILSDRMGIVGPLVREVFSMQRAFKLYVDAMKEKVRMVGTATELTRLSVFCIPSVLKYFVAPYPSEHDQADSMRHNFKYLSQYAALLQACSVMAPEFLRHAAMFGLDYPLIEAALCAILRRDSGMPKEWLTSWEWHHDPGYKTILSEQTEMAIVDIPRVGSCSRHVQFKGIDYEKNAQQLDGDTLYQSMTIMGKMFTVVKDSDGRTVAINMFQTTTMSLPDHPFTVATVMTTMTKFGLFDPDNNDVTLNLICLVDNTLETVKGLKFYDKDNDKVEELCQAFPVVDNRLKTFVVRAGIYHLDRDKIVSLPLLSEIDRSEHKDILNSHPVPYLRKLAQQRGLKGTSRLNKADLIDM